MKNENWKQKIKNLGQTKIKAMNEADQKLIK